jgi:hypothetical protein
MDIPRYLEVTGKRVQGDGDKKHLRGERLEIGVDVTPETAAKMVEFGTAIVTDGQSIDQVAKRKADADAIRVMIQQKQRADFEMEQYDRQSQETRDQLKETNGEIYDGHNDAAA